MNVISKYFGDLSITFSGNVYFLGMQIKDKRHQNCFDIIMKDYIQEAFDFFWRRIERWSNYPAYYKIFTTYDVSFKPLNKHKAKFSMK